MLAAMFEGGDQVKAYPQALTRGCEANAVIWAAPGGGGGQTASYWETYFKGVTKADKQGVQVSLGGSSVNNLQDNLVLYGLNGGPNVFAATYTVFANIVKQQYPKLVPDMLPVEKVLNTEYVLAVKAKYGQQAAMAADVPKFNTDTTAPITQKLGDRNWAINFDTGKSTFSPEAKGQLTELMNGLLIAGEAVIEIHGHTDATGDSSRNLALSQGRAQAVKDWLIQQGVDRDRFIKVQGHGDTEPVASNDTESGKAKNRRVTIILGKH
jgi:outer membrane protein OmpA-like peptidoglycan-associated protein